jgi:hypothetical protein
MRVVHARAGAKTEIRFQFRTTRLADPAWRSTAAGLARFVAGLAAEFSGLSFDCGLTSGFRLLSAFDVDSPAAAFGAAAAAPCDFGCAEFLVAAAANFAEALAVIAAASAPTGDDFG